MSVLFNVGNGVDDIDVFARLLDIEGMPSKPGYPLASPDPLILSDCEYVPDPFGPPPSQNYLSSPGLAFCKDLETHLVSVCQMRLGLDMILPSPATFFDERARRDRSVLKSVLEVQRARSVETKISSLKGNMKKRFDNVQEWKERVLEREEQDAGRDGVERSRSREAEKMHGDKEEKIAFKRRKFATQGVQDQRKEKDDANDD